MDFNEIQQELKTNNLAKVFPSIRQKAASIGNWEVTGEVENLWNTYQQMLQFMLNGVDDPQSGQIRQKVCRSLQVAVSNLERLERLKNNPSDKYVSTRKELKNVPSLESLVSQLEVLCTDLNAIRNEELMRDSVRQHRLEELEKSHETLLIHLFNWTWTSEIWQKSDVNQANRLIFSDNIGSNEKAVFISAVTLSLLEFADIKKVLFLLDCYLMEDELVSARSLVGFVLVFFLLYDKINGSKELLDRLTILRDDSAFVHECYSTMMQLQLSCTTDSVTSKMRNDIIPTLMQGQMKNNKDKKLNLKELTQNGENPEWIDSEKVDKKMREMAELQLSGADIYYSSFAMLKGFSFFGQMPHWFYPFTFNATLVPELRQVMGGRIGRFMKLILGSTPFCNSDKFSICFMFKNLGNMGEAAIEAQINRQIDGENIDELIDDAEQLRPKKSDLRRQYIFDLYRFFYSYPYKQQFQNPFAVLKEHPITPQSNAWLTMLLSGATEDLTQYADFLMRKQFYAAALQLFETLPKNEFEEPYAPLWQKIGFCQQKLSRPDEAIRAYTIANSLKPNSKWTLSHLAALHFAVGKSRISTRSMEEAAKFYTELLEIEPENQRYLLNVAEALVQSEQFEEALQHLHKAHYLDPTSTPVTLLLSWCLICNGQKDKAMKLILDLRAEDPQNTEAQTLFALVLLIDGQMREAYNQIRLVIDDDNKDDILDRLSTLGHLDLVSYDKELLFTDALALNID